MNPSLQSLRHKIRYASEPDNPQLITLWLEMENKPEAQPFKQRWQNYEASVRLLLDTLADELLPAHWRISCLDQIYRPLANLQRLVRTDDDLRHLRQLLYEVQVTSHFFNPVVTGNPNDKG